MQIDLRDIPYARVKLNDKWFVVKYRDAQDKDIFMFGFLNKIRTIEFNADDELADKIIMPYIEAGYSVGIDTTYPKGRGNPLYFYKESNDRVFLHILVAEYKNLISKNSKNPVSKKIWFWDGITTHIYMGNIDLLERVNMGKVACQKADRKLAKAS